LMMYLKQIIQEPMKRINLKNPIPPCVAA